MRKSVLFSTLKKKIGSRSFVVMLLYFCACFFGMAQLYGVPPSNEVLIEASLVTSNDRTNFGSFVTNKSRSYKASSLNNFLSYSAKGSSYGSEESITKNAISSTFNLSTTLVGGANTVTHTVASVNMTFTNDQSVPIKVGPVIPCQVGCFAFLWPCYQTNYFYYYQQTAP